MFYYLNMYFIGCFLGYMLETGMKTFCNPKMNNGILYGPWIPVYGFGIVLASFVTNKVFKMKISNRSKFIISFIILFITITVVEQLGGMLIEKVFHRTFWSYESKRFNIGLHIFRNEFAMGVFVFTVCMGIKTINRCVYKKNTKNINFINTWYSFDRCNFYLVNLV